MALPQYDIVFRGVRAGYDPERVKRLFAILFKLDNKKVERIFRSKKVTLKTAVDSRFVDKYILKLTAIGVAVDKREVNPGAFQTPEYVNVVAPGRVSRAIHVVDYGEESVDAYSMHQSVEAVYGEHIRRIPFIFNGTGFDYCKLWCVNLVACILTAGLLYPWAKIRRRRYFYEHTTLDAVAFRYRAGFCDIFLLQYLVILFLAALAAAFFTNSILCAVFFLLFLAFLPLYFVRQLTVDCQNSFYCDISFQFSGSLAKGYFTVLIWTLLALLSFGMLLPFAVCKVKHDVIDNITFAGQRFSLSTSVKKYLPLIPVILLAELGGFMLWYWRGLLPVWLFWGMLVLVGIIALVFCKVMLVNRLWNSIQYKPGYFLSNWTFSGYLKLVIRNVVLCLITGGLYWPWARVALAVYRTEHLAFFANPVSKQWLRNACYESRNPHKD